MKKERIKYIVTNEFKTNKPNPTEKGIKGHIQQKIFQIHYKTREKYF